MCGERRLYLAAIALALVGCGNHSLDLALGLATDTCTVPVPAGGSILYQIAIEGPVDGGGASSLCGGCLAVPNALADSNAILMFLRANAPACANVKPNSSIQIALTAYKVPACTDGQPSTRAFCAQSPSLPIPDGHADAVVSATLTCDPTCGANLTPPGTGQCVSGCAPSACSPCCTDSYSGNGDSNQTCPSGCSCALSCTGPSSCHFSCPTGSTCTASADNANMASVDCSSGATCQLKCGNNVGNSCTLNCNNASCLIDCGMNVDNCTINNCSGAVMNCPGNVKVCGRACP
jgi:hypothetical protein